MTEEQKDQQATEETSTKEPLGEDRGSRERQWTCPLGSAAKAMGCDARSARRFCMHMGKAGLEVLKAFETLLAAAAEEEPRAPKKKATKINID